MVAKKNGRMDRLDYIALEHFLGGPAIPPKGVAGVRLSNLISKGWILRSERTTNYGKTLYNITQKGREAYFLEKAISS